MMGRKLRFTRLAMGEHVGTWKTFRQKYELETESSSPLQCRTASARERQDGALFKPVRVKTFMSLHRPVVETPVPKRFAISKFIVS